MPITISNLIHHYYWNDESTLEYKPEIKQAKRSVDNASTAILIMRCKNEGILIWKIYSLTISSTFIFINNHHYIYHNKLDMDKRMLFHHLCNPTLIKLTTDNNFLLLLVRFGVNQWFLQSSYTRASETSISYTIIRESNAYSIEVMYSSGSESWSST